MKERKTGKGNRTLELYARLADGNPVNLAEAAAYYGVNKRSIQRDLEEIRAFLEERRNQGRPSGTVAYDRRHKAFFLKEEAPAAMNNSEILAVCKILLESRAFTRAQMDSVIDKLIRGCVPRQNAKTVSDLLANERFHYVELRHKSDSLEKMWELGEAVKTSRLVELDYMRVVDTDTPVKRMAEPVAITFSEYYFYLIAYQVETDGDGNVTRQLYDYPTVFRMDRIVGYKVTRQHFRIPYRDRFEDGEFRKRVQFMHPGRLPRIEFRYTGMSVEAILDRLPTAEIIRHDETGYYQKAEVFGTGIMMWLLSQGSNVEVLGPPELRAGIRETVEKMRELYRSSQRAVFPEM